MENWNKPEQLSLLRWLLCGLLIGGGTILPGVSGGVLAVVFDMYRPFMELLTEPRRAVPRYWKMLVPVGIGWCVGFLGFAKGVAAAIALSEAVTVWLFIGLIFGTIPSLFREAGKEGRSRASWVSMAFCAAVVFLGLFYVSYVMKIQLQPGFWSYNLCGVLWGMGIVIPGLTTSSVIMALGLYEPLMQGLAALDLPVLSASLPGLIVTLLLLARSVKWLFRRHYSVAFHGILGIVLASTLVIVPLEYSGLGEQLLSALFALGGAGIAFYLQRLDGRIREA